MLVSSLQPPGCKYLLKWLRTTVSQMHAFSEGPQAHDGPLIKCLVSIVLQTACALPFGVVRLSPVFQFAELPF